MSFTWIARQVVVAGCIAVPAVMVLRGVPTLGSCNTAQCDTAAIIYNGPSANPHCTEYDLSKADFLLSTGGSATTPQSPQISSSRSLSSCAPDCGGTLVANMKASDNGGTQGNWVQDAYKTACGSGGTQ